MVSTISLISASFSLASVLRSVSTMTASSRASLNASSWEATVRYLGSSMTLRLGRSPMSASTIIEMVVSLN